MVDEDANTAHCSGGEEGARALHDMHSPVSAIGPWTSHFPTRGPFVLCIKRRTGTKAGPPELRHGRGAYALRTYPWLRQKGGSVQGHPIQILLLLRGFWTRAAAPAAAADGAAAAPAPSPALCSHRGRHQTLLLIADSPMPLLTAGSITDEPEKH